MRAIDLFAGAGGFSTGASMAGCRVLWAANHWPVAVKWHAANHPETEHACQDLQQADFRAAPAHDILLASPACQGHSPARGKDRPHHDAQRATAWAVVSCAEVHRPPVVVVENVPAFAAWVLYPAWCAAMHALGYALAPMILDAADAGVPQQRRRLFVVATRSRHPIELQLPRREHQPAAAAIDFSAGRWSPIERPGRSARTLARIAAGRRSFGARFVAPYYGSGSGETGRSLGRPIGTLTTRARWAVVDGERMRMVLATEGRELMGLPAGYLLPANEATAWHLIGQAVCPPQAAQLIDAIRRAA
ncbi:DNA cytosine methyltransferase [Rubrivivax gelatinosus]|uniref:DNA (cytosine-5-)-methyltransferase n=1 Tax=Rubrivivax gelatinosus TaxID=28068 RepID=A0A4R2MK39_RUBGE|nr:DNA cytosine methyltransferase [Rubrivivax gelatinosus]MBK1686229.1 DNA (cytosine-5-)-methyltransferase [Rubrivivax gelatinosus]TCP05725.1 DNA (cytosine-5)-methyltransferase 1 [Rubrivivax gelatinosus]